MRAKRRGMTTLLIKGEKVEMPAAICRKWIAMETALAPFADAGRDLPDWISDHQEIGATDRAKPAGTIHILEAHQLRAATKAWDQ